MSKQQFKELFWYHNLGLWILAIVGAGLGIWLISSPPTWMNNQVASSIGSSILGGVIASGIIGWFFQQRLAKDVFEASIGYLLHEELKPTLKWIYDQKFLCVKSVHQYRLELKGGIDGTIVTVKTNRTFKNIGKNTETFYVGLAIDKGYSTDYPSKITEFGYQVEKNRYEETEKELNNNNEKRTYTIARKPVEVPPDKEIDTWSSHTFEKHLPDDSFAVFSYPSVNPEVFVNCDPKIKPDVAFAYGPDPNTMKRLGKGRYRLDGVLLPMQHIRVKWEKKDEPKKD